MPQIVKLAAVEVFASKEGDDVALLSHPTSVKHSLVSDYYIRHVPAQVSETLSRIPAGGFPSVASVRDLHQFGLFLLLSHVLPPSHSWSILVNPNMQIVPRDSKVARKSAFSHLRCIITAASSSFLSSSWNFSPWVVKLWCQNQFYLHLISDGNINPFGKGGYALYCTFCTTFSPHAPSLKSPLFAKKHTRGMLGRTELRMPQQLWKFGKFVSLEVQ